MDLLMKPLIALVAGFLFSFGLCLGGMTRPQVVIGFLDLSAWNPALLFVMLGALLVHAPAYYFLKHRKTPFLDLHWHLPRTKKVTGRLVFGSMIFGIGWGLAGYCPGPALASLSTRSSEIIGFVLMMVAGMKAANILIGSKK